MDSTPDIKRWTREQLLIAFKLYCEIPFGKMHSRNPQIIRFAKAIGRTPSSLAMKLTNIASLDPAIRGSGRKGVTGASRADKEMWVEMSSDWSHFSLEIDAVEKQFHLRVDSPSSVDSVIADFPDYSGKTKQSLIQTRIGQSFFRKSVLSAYDFQCCISGITLNSLLIASHIVPWKTDTQNRLNPQNGLCLSAIHDKAFDAGLISLDNDFKLLIARSIRDDKNDMVRNLFLPYEAKQIRLPEKFFPSQEFIEYHRREIFHG